MWPGLCERLGTMSRGPIVKDVVMTCIRSVKCRVQGARCMVHGARCVVHGAWCMVHGARYVVQGARYTVYNAKRVHANGHKGKMKEKQRLASAPGNEVKERLTSLSERT